MEIGRRFPARFHLAAARHAVAFAADLHVPGEHQPAGMVVVQIDLRLDVAGLFARVEEHLGEGDAVVHVVRAAAPFPAGRVASAVRESGSIVILFLKSSIKAPMPARRSNHVKNVITRRTHTAYCSAPSAGVLRPLVPSRS